MATKTLNIGLIGAGYMGKVHSIALHSVAATFQTPLKPIAEMICTSNAAGAQQKAQDLGFRRSTHCWQDLVCDEAINAVIIATPPETHRDIAVMALQHKKHVFCEKPLAATLEESREMTMRAQSTGLVNMVGFNYIQTPAVQAARQMIADGDLGRIYSLRIEHSEDYGLVARQKAESWRLEGQSNGAAKDLAPHLINCALALGGEITCLTADISGMDGDTLNDDHGHILCRFASGALGNLFFSRIATGQKMGYRFEVYGERGALKYDQEDQNTLWYYEANRPKAISGFTKILTSDAHPDFQALCSGDGHGTGYTEQIVIQMRNFLCAIHDGSRHWPTFAEGYQVDQIIQSAFQSTQSKQWVSLP